MAGDLAGGDGPADVQRLLRPTESELLGCLGQGGVEVQGVGEVELALDAGGAVEGDLVVVETHVATIGGLGGVGGCLLGHEPDDCFLDEAFEGGVPDLVGEPGDLGIDEPDGFGGQQQGVLGDPAGPPGLEVTGHHPGPHLGQAVLELDRVGDQGAAGVGGEPDREGEFGDAELRDQGCPRPGQEQTGVATGGDPGRGVVDRLGWVLLGPGGGTQENGGLGGVGCSALVTHEPQHVRGAVELLERSGGGGGHVGNSSTEV